MESLSIDNMTNILVAAAWYGAAADVDSFLRRYGLFCLNMCSRPQGVNALHAAVITNKMDTVQLLLRAKVWARTAACAVG